MAAASATFTAVSGPAALVSKGDASKLSSGNAFRSSSMVQFAPLSSKKCNRIVAARASLPEDSTVGRDAVLSIIAIGAAVGLSVSVVDGAFANPLTDAKNKAVSTLKGAKGSLPDLPTPLAPSPGGAFDEAKKNVEENKMKAGGIAQQLGAPNGSDAGGIVDDAKKNVGSIAEGIKTRADGIFGKNKPGPKSLKAVARSNGGTGSAFGDAKKRLSNFGKNPIAENIAKTSERTGNSFANAGNTAKPNDQRVAEATDKVSNITSNLQNQGKDAISEGKNFLGGAQGNLPSLPSLPNLVPQLPNTPDIGLPDAGKGVQDLKSGVQSNVEKAKNAAGNAIPQ